MGQTLAVEAKQALVDLLRARPNLEGKQIAYGWPGGDMLEEDSIYTAGRTRWVEYEPASMRTGRTHRNETVEFDVIVVKFAPGGTAEDAEVGVVELGREVEECVADNRTFDVDGIQSVTVRQVALVSVYNDNGHASELTYTVRYVARLT